MVNVDAREKEVKAAEAEHKAETAAIEKEKDEARRVTAEDQKQLVEWNAKRDALRQGVSEDVLRQYERVAKFRGTGLAEVRDQKCMGCQVKLRPQTYNEVRNGEKVMICESCSRVYYFNPANEVKPEQEVVTVTGRKRARPKADARRRGSIARITVMRVKCYSRLPIAAAIQPGASMKCTPGARLEACFYAKAFIA